MNAHDDAEDVQVGTNVDAIEGEPSSWGPVGPDGAPMMVPMPPPVQARPFTPQHVPCLRDCRFYMVAETHFGVGNRGIGEAIQVHHACLVQDGVFRELSADSPVYECSRWEPLPPGTLIELAALRRDYFDRHPEHRPAPPETKESDAADATD